MNTRADPHPAGRRATHTDPVGRRVLIVDDQAEYRAIARELLLMSGFDIVGEAADGATAVIECERLRPGVVLLDVQLPDADGFAVAAQLAQQDPAPVIVLTSSRDVSAYRQRLAISPARGFIPKAELSGASLAALIA